MSILITMLVNLTRNGKLPAMENGNKNEWVVLEIVQKLFTRKRLRLQECEKGLKFYVLEYIYYNDEILKKAEFTM